VRFHVGVGMFHRADSLSQPVPSQSLLLTSMARPPFVNPMTIMNKTMDDDNGYGRWRFDRIIQYKGNNYIRGKIETK
jgi:hypothetical protein